MDSYQLPTEREVNVIVYCGKDFSSKKSDSNYSVVFGVNKKKCKTQPINSDIPVWNEEASFFVNERHHHIKLSLRDKDEKIGYVTIDSSDLQSRKQSKGRWYDVKSVKNNALIIAKLYVHAYHVNPATIPLSAEDRTNSKKSKLNIFKFRRSFSNLSKGNSVDLLPNNDSNKYDDQNDITRRSLKNQTRKPKNRRLSDPIAVSARNNFATLSSTTNKGSDLETSTDSSNTTLQSNEEMKDKTSYNASNGLINYNQSNATSARLTSAKFRNQNQIMANGLIRPTPSQQDQQENVAHLRAASYIGDEKYPFTLHDDYWSATVEHYRRLVSDLQERIRELTDQNKALVGKYQDLCRECTTQLDYIQRLVNVLMKVDPDELEKMMPC